LSQDVLVSASAGADRPWAADIFGAGRKGVVGALAVGPADRMDGRQIQDIETHSRHVREARLDVAKRPVPVWFAGGRAGKQLIPAAELRALSVSHELECGAGSEAPVGVARNDRRPGGVECDRLHGRCIEVAVHSVGGRPQPSGPGRQGCPVVHPGARRRLLYQSRPDFKGGADIRAIFTPLELASPGFEMIDPRHDGVAIAPGSRRSELGAPYVIRMRRHDCFMNLRIAHGAPLQHGPQLVMAVREAVRFDADRFAGDPFDGKPAAIDHRQHGVDHGPHAAIRGRPRLSHRLPSAA